MSQTYCKMPKVNEYSTKIFFFVTLFRSDSSLAAAYVCTNRILCLGLAII